MTARIELFPVDNGDMTLITLESGKRILVDINIRKDADDQGEDDVPDVGTMLRDRLDRDAGGRYFVDSFLLTHPDADHCRGLERHFHLGKPSDWKEKDDKIFIRELWSSPIIFRRKEDLDRKLCKDANAWWSEARRRVKVFRDAKSKDSTKDGDRILVLGEDRDGKTDDLDDIRVDIDENVTRVCGKVDGTFEGLLLAPLPSKDEDDEESLEKNLSSVIIRFNFRADSKDNAGRYLVAGDAEVEIWKRLWRKHKKTADNLSYNLLLTPHHCSWHSLSFDSWSDKGEDAELDSDARNALAQARAGAFLIASSKPIKDDDDDPPCIRAKREYVAIAKEATGSFLCVMEPDTGDPDVVLFEIGGNGPKRSTSKSGQGGPVVFGAGGSGSPPPVDKKGGGRYA
jgi:hypothetical protein